MGVFGMIPTCSHSYCTWVFAVEVISLDGYGTPYTKAPYLLFLCALVRRIKYWKGADYMGWRRRLWRRRHPKTKAYTQRWYKRAFEMIFSLCLHLTLYSILTVLG